MTPTPVYVNRLKQDPKKGRVKLAQTLDTKVKTYILRFMDTLPLHYTKWSDRLAFDVALTLEGSGDSLQDVITRHKIGPQEILDFNKDPVFLKKVEHFRGEIQEKGLTFKMKARAQAEELLTTSWMLIHSPDVSAAVKADLIKSTVKWGGLEPKGDTVAEGGGGVRITINLGGQQHEAQFIEAATEVTDVQSIESV